MSGFLVSLDFRMQGELRKRIRFRSLFGISALLYVVFYVSLFHFKWILL